MHRTNCVLMSVLLMIADGLIVKGPSAPLVAPLGSSVVLPCSVDERVSVDDLEVEWRRTDSDTLVHLFQDGKSQTEVQHQDYQDRAHFFTEEIQHGNFSLRLDKLRAEDQGKYTCTVHSQQESGETVVQIKADDVEHLRVSGSKQSIYASVGEDVTLNCSVESPMTLEDIEEVLWKKTEEEGDLLVLFYQDHKALPEATDERYRDRVEFFTDEIPKLNFSLRLKSVRTEDKGVYMCEVFAGGLSANTTVELEQLGFSAVHILVLILCVSASVSALLLCCLIYCRSPYKGFFGQQTYKDHFNLGSSVVLPCHVDECVLKKKLKVEWRKKDTKTLVHLYQDGESRPQQDYQNRAHFFTDQIQHGNFSLRLDDLRPGDAGEYICKVHSFTSTRTAETSLVPRFKVKGSSGNKTASLGDSVVLRCEIDRSLLQKSLKVEWRRTDSETLVHLYQDGESRAKKQHKDYQDRAHFITEEIKDGNFSLRLDKLRTKDAGKYTCTVHSDQDCVHSAEAEIEILEFDVECSRQTLAPLGSSVVLPCYGNKPLPVDDLKVEWRRKDTKTLVHLHEDGKSRAEEQDYQDRAHFFTEEIQHGNFSLRLDKLRAGDEGKYTCTIYSQQESFSAETNLLLKQLDVFRLQMSLVFCPNILMFISFVLWGVSEGSLNETISCCAFYLLRPLLLLWAAPYIDHFTDTIKSLIKEYSYVAEYLVLSLVVYSALFTSAWKKLLNYTEADRAIIIVLFVIVFVCCLCKIIYILVTEVGQKSGRIIEIFDLVADVTFEILPTLQFILLFYTFGGAGAEIIIIILPLLLMMTNDRWLYRCRVRLHCSFSVLNTVMLIFIIVTNVLMIGVYIFTLENQTDAIGWGCVIVFLQILWTFIKFASFGDLDEDFHRYAVVYVFGSVGVVLLNSAALITELILKTVNGDRMMADLRFIVFPSECLFAIFVLISAIFPSAIAKCLQSCQNIVRQTPASRSQQNQNTAELSPLNTEDRGENELDSVESQT